MSQPRFSPTISLCVALVLFQICNGQSFVDHNETIVMTKRVCTKSIGECLMESEMDSESNRRVLAMQKKYISYDTLKRDMVPCDRPGASYYNCHAMRANPYSRGCEVITACARGQAIKT
ncbi:protein RALF-like 24 [Cajanus cajan]|uniref:Protein RALF-like 24 n=1 Tax=Cajanus cajan TaxID=3821 RepID=A0A151SQJ0_CAJCA|nr:protein RALF-like 24 [Cajanus cajan]KYP57009.1 hypothetical protein KK1_003261 [Cajanus cajan]